MELPLLCLYRMNLGGADDEWYSISQICRNRVSFKQFTNKNIPIFSNALLLNCVYFYNTCYYININYTIDFKYKIII